VLPDISGVELISTLRKKIANLEVITVTGFSSWETAFQVMKCGASDYLTKPVSKQVLLDSVTTAMERRYQKYVWPEVRMGFVETKLSDQFKITILKDLCKDRLESGALVLMDDLFVCFPELKNTCIPGGVSIPRNLYDNLEEFVLSLKERLSHFSTI
jgi:DNA-binding response OmpR family regulator